MKFLGENRLFFIHLGACKDKEFSLIVSSKTEIFNFWAATHNGAAIGIVRDSKEKFCLNCGPPVLWGHIGFPYTFPSLAEDVHSDI